MAATTSQGKHLTGFLVGLTALCAGGMGFSSGTGKLAALVGAVLLVASLFGLLRIKKDEGKIAAKPAPLGGLAVGAVLAIGGWLLIVVGLQYVTGVGARMVLAVVGIGVSLAGVIGVLPAAFNKNAAWKG